MSAGRQVGRYEILEEIGRGGMARVHLARQLDLDRFTALKELGSLQREDAEMVGRFLRESRLAGALNHPNIVTVLDFFEHDDVRYIAMEYVPRGSLRPWVGRLSLTQVGGVLESVLAGLAHAHAAGVVHRDLKPENLMVTAEGRVKITDFGIAKALAEDGTAAVRTATGVALGTPAYMAPEQAMGQGIGPWTDLYACGVIAYELLSGAVPFSSHEPLAVLLAHCQQEPPPLRDRAPDVPAPIADWVHALLAKEPADRPESAHAAWEGLEEHLLEASGPRWRRAARIEGEPDGAATPSGQPVTPSRFPTDTRATSEDDAWETFGAPTPPDPVRTPPAGETPPSGAITAGGEIAAGGAAPSGRGRRAWVAAGVGGVLAAAVVAVVLLSGGGEKPATHPAGSPVAPLGDGWVRAVHVVSYEPGGLEQPPFVDALRRAKHDGATEVILHALIEPVSPRSSTLRVKSDAPTDAAIVQGLRAADDEGLDAVVEPIVEPEDSYPGAYEPKDPDAFFDAYAERLAAYAVMVRQHDGDGIVVGTMLSNLDGPDYTDRWAALLDDTRSRCNCRVTYAAENVDGAQRVQFWNAADAIGVDVTEPVSNRQTTDPAALARAWAPVKARLQALSARWRKPVGLLELGYESKADQPAKGAYEADGKPSEQAQAALYEAAFRAFRGVSWFAGIGWSELNGDGAAPAPDDVGFAGKRAEDVMRAWQTAS